MKDIVLSPKELRNRWNNKITTQSLGLWRKNGIGPKFFMLSPRRVCYYLTDVIEFEKTRNM